MGTINGRDYLKSGEPNQIVSDTGVVFNLRGVYQDDVEYREGDAVVSNGWFSIVNKGVTATTELSAPQNLGAASYSPLGATTFDTDSDASVVTMKYVYTTDVDGYMTTLYIKVPSYDANVRSTITATIGDQHITFSDPILKAGEWVALSTGGNIVLSGSDIEIKFSFKNVDDANSITGGWTSNWGTTTPPGNQTFSFSSNTQGGTGTLVIDHTDLDSTERTTELRGVITGSTATLVESADTARSLTIEFTSGDTTPTEVYSTYTYNTTDVGSKSAVRDAKTTTVTIDVPIVTNTDYYKADGEFTTKPPEWGTVVSSLRFDGVDQAAPTDTAYGMSLGFQPIVQSADWQQLSHTMMQSGSNDAGLGFTSALSATDMENHDYELVLSTGNNLGTTLNRNEIEAVLLLNGVAEPVVNVTFKIQDASDHVFIVSYMANMDEYMYERLSKAN